MIKGKYVATIILNFHIDENDPGLLPFEKLHEQARNGTLDKAVVAVLSDEFGDIASVGLDRHYADLYRLEECASNE